LNCSFATVSAGGKKNYLIVVVHDRIPVYPQE